MIRKNKRYPIHDRAAWTALCILFFGQVEVPAAACAGVLMSEACRPFFPESISAPVRFAQGGRIILRPRQNKKTSFFNKIKSFFRCPNICGSSFLPIPARNRGGCFLFFCVHRASPAVRADMSQCFLRPKHCHDDLGLRIPFLRIYDREQTRTLQKIAAGS